MKTEYPKHLNIKVNYKGKMIIVNPTNYTRYKNILTLRDRRLFKEYFSKKYVPKWLN